jgi:type I restriction enzyme S subunit
VKHVKLKWLVSASNAGEVIDRSYWGEGEESLYTCARDILRSDFSAFPKWKRTTPDDLLLTRNGTPYIHIPVEGAIYSNVVQRISVPKVDKYYLRYALEDRVRSFRGYGVSIESLNYEMWSNLEVALPDLTTQRQIADFLDRETARIDLLIEKKQRLVALLGEKKDALINELSTFGTSRHVEYRNTDVFWLPRVPASWQVVSANRIFAERKGRALNDDKQLTASQKYGMIFQDEFMEREGHKVTQVITGGEILKHTEPDDYIISMRSFQGGLEYNPYRGSMSSAYVAVYPKIEIDFLFFKYLFKSRGFVRALQMTSNLVRDGQALRYANFRQVDIPVPPIEEQTEIGFLLDQKLGRIEEVTEPVTKSIDRLKEYRSALITAAVTGQIDVTTYAKSGTSDRRLDAIQEEIGA